MIFFPFANLALVILGTAIGSFLTPIGLLHTDVGRACLVGGPWDSLAIAAAITAAAFLLLLVGWTIFHITVPRIIERMGM